MKTQTKRKILDAMRRVLRLEPEPVFAPQLTTYHYSLQTETIRACQLPQWRWPTVFMDEWESRAKENIARDIGRVLLKEGFINFHYDDTADFGYLIGQLSATRPLPHWQDEEQRTWRDTPAGQRVIREEEEFQRREEQGDDSKASGAGVQTTTCRTS